MTLEQYIVCRKKAVSANFKSRNVRVFVHDLRQKRIQSDRRKEIRLWISELRQATQATSPVSVPLIAERVRWSIN